MLNRKLPKMAMALVTIRDKRFMFVVLSGVIGRRAARNSQLSKTTSRT